MTVAAPADITLLPDAGPLITLAYADALDLLFKPGWTLNIVDMVMHEVTRNQTPTSARLAAWVDSHRIPLVGTTTFTNYQRALQSNDEPRRKNLGELAIQETLNAFGLSEPPKVGVFLFEDHKIARSSFRIPPQCHKISTRAFLVFLEENDLIPSVPPPSNVRQSSPGAPSPACAGRPDKQKTACEQAGCGWNAQGPCINTQSWL